MPALRIDRPRPRVARARRRAADRPRRGPHAGVRAARDEGDRAGLLRRGGRGARLRDGARQHLPPVPAPRRRADRALGGLHRFMGWERRDRSPTPAASRSSRWATARSPTRSRPAQPVRAAAATAMRAGSNAGAILAIEEEGVRFRSYVDGRERFLSPGELDGGAGAAALGHRARLRRVHALPRRPRLHRALDRAHPPLARALPAPGAPSTARAPSLFYGIVQGGVYEDLRSASARRSPRAAATASRSAARSGARRRRCTRSSAGRHARARAAAHEARPATCWGSARSTT